MHVCEHVWQVGRENPRSEKGFWDTAPSPAAHTTQESLFQAGSVGAADREPSWVADKAGYTLHVGAGVSATQRGSHHTYTLPSDLSASPCVSVQALGNVSLQVC